MIPIFHTNLSLLSILTTENSGKSSDDEAPSIFDCAKDLGLKKIFVADDYPAAFEDLKGKQEKEGVQVCYGLRFKVSHNPETPNSWARYTIWAKNGAGFKELCKIYCHYSTTGRILSFKFLTENFSKNLILMPNFYDGPFYNNLLCHEWYHLLDFQGLKPLFEMQDNGLPIDSLIRDKIEEFCNNHKYPVINTKSIYYRKKEEFKSFMAYKCIVNRSSFDKPELAMFSSDQFCTEAINQND